jgi:hypothetical protein
MVSRGTDMSTSKFGLVNDNPAASVAGVLALERFGLIRILSGEIRLNTPARQSGSPAAARGRFPGARTAGIPAA